MSLYERLGGRDNIEACVTDFYKRVCADPELELFFKYANMHRLRKMMTEFLVITFGDHPPAYDKKYYMCTAHKHVLRMGATRYHFDRVVKHMSVTLTEKGGADPLLKKEALTRLLYVRNLFPPVESRCGCCLQ
jgi:hemoglobin